ncbi:MAG: DUF488 family protein [Candidatus Thermoplasmatota archaeon]
MNLTNETYVILIGTKTATERYYREKAGWVKVSTRGRKFRATAEQVLNHLLPALSGVKPNLTVKVEHHEPVGVVTKAARGVRKKRAFEPASEDDGIRILVDRLWPRGVSKERARIHTWLREVAPSDGLCKYYGHDPKKSTEFKRRYEQELADDPVKQRALRDLRALVRRERVTLVYASRDDTVTNAEVLLRVLTRKRSRGSPAE